MTASVLYQVIILGLEPGIILLAPRPSNRSGDASGGKRSSSFKRDIRRGSLNYILLQSKPKRYDDIIVGTGEERRFDDLR